MGVRLKGIFVLVVLVVGVNGSGKTTTIAKLGKRFKEAGKSLVFGAADTFRAAAVDQLQVWGDRLGVDVIAGAPAGRYVQTTWMEQHTQTMAFGGLLKPSVCQIRLL